MKYTLLILTLFLLGGCDRVSRKNFDDCIKVGNECIDLGWRLTRQKDSLETLLTAYKYAEIKNYRTFGADERFMRVNQSRQLYTGGTTSPTAQTTIADEGTKPVNIGIRSETLTPSVIQ